MPAQPQDEWTFLRPEEFTDDDALDRIDASLDVSAEENAMHECDLDDRSDLGAGLDPGRTLGLRERDDGSTARYFDDEEPDTGRRGLAAEAEVEPALDQLLQSQHYSFEPDAQ